MSHRAPRVSGPATLAARQELRAALADLPPGARLLVACSGGPDSLALAVTVAHAAPAAGWVARALVVDHGLRAGSAEESARVAERLRDLGLPTDVVAVDTGIGPGGPEARAREARWAALRAHADGATVLTGHTMDDQAETVLLGLARGSGARSIAGMRPAEAGVRRPFLALRRAQTLAVCEELGLTAVHDPTNSADGPWRAADGSALRRAAVRDRALPALAAALGTDPVPALARTADQARRDDDALTKEADALLDRAVAAGREPVEVPAAEVTAEAGPGIAVGGPDTEATAEAGPGVAVGGPDTEATGEARPGIGFGPGLVLDAATLAAAHPAVRSRALRAAGERAGWRPGDVKHAHLDALDALVTRYRGQGPAHLPGIVARRACGRLILAPSDDEGATWTQRTWATTSRR